MIRYLVLAFVFVTSAALADPAPVVVKGKKRPGNRPQGNAPVVVQGPNQPNHGPRPAPRPQGNGPVIVNGPTHNGPRPVRVSPTRVYRGPRVIIAPRVVNRHWVRYPNVVIVRHYPIAIAPIYLPIVQQPYSQTMVQGELWPSDTDYLFYFTHYTFSMERQIYPNGLTDMFVTLHPQTICQDPNGCGYVAPRAPVQLRVTQSITDACGTVHTTAVATNQFAEIQSLRLTDYSRYFCGGNVAPGTTYFELGASIVHYGGFAEPALNGNRSF